MDDTGFSGLEFTGDRYRERKDSFWCKSEMQFFQRSIVVFIVRAATHFIFFFVIGQWVRSGLRVPDLQQIPIFKTKEKLILLFEFITDD